MISDMKYDFTTFYQREGLDASAVDDIGRSDFAPGAPDPGYDVIPMWVADMNFATAPSITRAIHERLEHPLFGYFEPRDEYYRKIISWQEKRNGITGLEKEQLGYENGVLGGVVSALSVLCKKKGRVLLHVPYYVGFIGTLQRAGYEIVTSKLVQDSLGHWRMDFSDMEKKMQFGRIDAMIFCSPHNPCGRVWDKWEIEQAMQLCEQYNIPVVSDEIWSDLILPGYHHIPTQSVSPYARNNTVALYAPSKTFNLAGLIGSYHIIYDRELKEKIDRQAAICHYNSMNVLSMYALLGAYSDEGEAWLEELRDVLQQNMDLACDFLEKNLPELHVSRPEGTYMLFADCEDYMKRTGKSLDDVLHACWKVGVALQDGRQFGSTHHVRINLASPYERIKEAFQRMKDLVFIP